MLGKPIKIKICCIKEISEADLAISFGAHAIGLVGPMPSGPGVVSDTISRKIANYIPTEVESFLLTSETESKKIIQHHKKVRTSTIQLVDHVHASELIKVRESLPDVKLVQVIHVIDEANIAEALEVQSYVDYILLDSGNPSKSIKELGGTGKVHNWNISKTLVQETNVPVFLAGGLNANNVAEAIEFVNPFGIDLCSGVRTNDVLDKEKLSLFFEAVHPYT